MEPDSLEIILTQLQENQEKILEEISWRYWGLWGTFSLVLIPISWAIGTIRDKLSDLMDLNKNRTP